MGFGDYRKAENIIESYDFVWGQFGMLAPLQTIIKDGILYQFAQNNIHILYYAEYLAVFEEKKQNIVYTSPVLYPRNELNIYWEYALKFLNDKNPFKALDLYIRKKYKIHQKKTYALDHYFIAPLFKGQKGRKQRGLNFLLVVVLPTLLISGIALSKGYKALGKMSPRRRHITLAILGLMIAAVAF